MDGPPPQEEDFTGLTISERLAHKNWKARVNGYESLIKTFETTASDNDPAFRPYINNSELLKKIVTDANAVAQEKGVECIVALLKFAGETAAKTRDTVVPALVDKCLGSTRAGTRNQATETVLQYVEVENGGVGVVNDLLSGLSAKQPKTVSGCVCALREITRLFGAQVVPTSSVLKALAKIFAHSDKNVRAEGSNLTLVLYQYLGPGIESWLGELKPVQVKELKDSFETLEKQGKGHKSLKPERLTRAAAREVAAATESPDDVAESVEDVTPPDPRQFAEVVDIVPSLSPSLQSDLKSSKWKERKEALDNLSNLLASTPRIKESPELVELAKVLANCIAKDANINCVIVSAKCLEDLAKGMMTSFARHHEAVVPLMLERLKERKINVTDAIGSALDAVFLTSTLNDILPDLDGSLKSKNPQIKEGTLKFLNRCFASTTIPIQTGAIKPLAETLAILLEDGYEGARNEAASCFGYLMKMVGERPLNAVMDNIADIRKAKIKEAFERATVKCKTGSGAPPQRAAPPPVTKKPASKASKQEKPLPEDVPAPPKPSAPLKNAGKPAPKKPPTTAPPVTAPPSKKSATAATVPKVSNKSAIPPGSLDSVKYKHPPEEAESLAAELIPGNILSDLGDANWKTRLAALDELSAWLEGQLETLDAEILVRCLAKRGWSEKNFQVSSKIYGILTLLSQQCQSFGRACIAICVPHLTEKLGDMKLKKPAGDALLAFSEKTSLQFVLGQAYDPLSSQKAPKVLSDAIAWINTALTEFGIAGLTLRNLIDFLKVALQNSNAAVRTSATKTLVTVKLFAGLTIKSFIEDLNPQLLNTIQGEFDKVDGHSAPEPVRFSTDLASLGNLAQDSKAGTGIDPLDDLFPRVDIDSLFKGTTILTDAKNDAWKTKKEALETLQAILDQGSNKRLKPTMGEIGHILKARVTDTNKAVQSLSLDIVARIATGMGKPFEKYSRLFTLSVSTVLSDQKAPIRTAALQTISAMAEACDGLESMVSGFTTALETQNPLQKSTLMQWLADWFKIHPIPSGIDLKGWAPHVVSSLDDRSGDVRKAAQGLIPVLIQASGYDFVLNQTNSLKPASRASITPLIQAARPSTSEQSIPPSKSTSVKVATLSPDSPVSPISDGHAVSAAAEAKAPSKLSGVRRKIPLGTSRPDSRAESVDTTAKSTNPVKKHSAVATSKPSTSAVASNPALPFINANTESKKLRLARDANRWVNEGGPTRKDLAELLQGQMEPCASKDLISRLFSHDHNAVNDHINGLTTLADFYSGISNSDENSEKLGLANLDFPLKYVSIKIHEPQPNLVSKCLDVVEAILAFLRQVNYQLADIEATCFVPTVIHKLGDAREQVRLRVQQIIRTLPTIYAYSRIFQLLLEHGLKAKVAKTRQGTLDELSVILKKSGTSSCEPSKAFPQIAALISDKDPQVRKSALGALSEAYTLLGEKVWSLVGPLSAKDKTQLEERLRRVPGPSLQGKSEPSMAPAPGVARLTNPPRSGSPSIAVVSRIARSASPALPARTTSPAPPLQIRPESPNRAVLTQSSTGTVPTSPGKVRPRSLLPSRLARPRTNNSQAPNNADLHDDQPPTPVNGVHDVIAEPLSPKVARSTSGEPRPASRLDLPEEIALTISSILSNDPSRSVEALKKVQKILSIGPDNGPSSPQYRELAEHTEGLIETITLQMAHVFEHPGELILDENFRLAKHLIQTLNNFCDHPFLAESLTVDILTALLEELTIRLLETDDSSVKKVKDLSRFINMIILRLFATGRRMSIFRALFALLLQIVKPFPSNATLPESKAARVAELVLKCVWKLARNIPQDLSEAQLDPVELFPAIEHFLQSVPPNEWRARATNKVPCGDMPLRTIKVIIQHIVAQYGDDVYELLSASFDDPSATIVYPYVYRILNSSNKVVNEDGVSRRNGNGVETMKSPSPEPSRPLSPPETASSTHSNNRPSSHRTSASSSSAHGVTQFTTQAEEPDPDAQLLVIIGHISSETTGALHKEGITELHHFLKAHPHKRARVEKMLESTGAAFRKYINRALASRAAEDQERTLAVADTLSKHNTEDKDDTTKLNSPPPGRPLILEGAGGHEEKLSRLHDIFRYRSSTISTTGQERSSPRTSLGA